MINASFCIDARGILAAFGLHWIWDRNSEWNWRFMLYKRRGEGQWGFAEAVVDVVSVQLELPQAERRASLAPNKQI